MASSSQTTAPPCTSLALLTPAGITPIFTILVPSPPPISMSSRLLRSTPAPTSPPAPVPQSPASQLHPPRSRQVQPSVSPGRSPAPPTSSSRPKSAPLAPPVLLFPPPPPPPTPSTPPMPSAKPLPRCPSPCTDFASFLSRGGAPLRPIFSTILHPCFFRGRAR